MSRPRFAMDRSFEGALLGGAEFREVLQGLVDEAVPLAEDLAPDDPDTVGDDLHSSIFGEVGMTRHGWTGRVGATDFKASWYEEGASTVRAQPFLRPAVEETVGPIEAGPADGDA